jgi:hypothetical protein
VALDAGAAVLLAGVEQLLAAAARQAVAEIEGVEDDLECVVAADLGAREQQIARVVLAGEAGGQRVGVGPEQQGHGAVLVARGGAERGQQARRAGDERDRRWRHGGPHSWSVVWTVGW